MFPKYYKPLSQRFYKVLEDIGVSTEIRDLMGKYCTSLEIRQTMCLRLAAETYNTRARSSNSRVTGTNPVSIYICGSSFEGTTTKGMESDIDELIVAELLPVATDISDAQLHNICLLMLQDFYTPPGYAKLQLVVDSVQEFLSSVCHLLPMTGYEREYRSIYIDNRDTEDGEMIHGPARPTLATNTAYDYEGREVLIYTQNIKGDVVHGPARTIPQTGFNAAVDKVVAFRCRKIPDCASEWFTRQRHYNWPTPEWIDKCKTLGCFFVYVGHPDSEESHLQWRMSFSLQERFLVTRFNSVQLKCYSLMKIIKKEIVYQDVGEKSLTSYHCKTCLLYLIENSPAEFWREENLLVCLCTYLSQILRCVETMDCPNYFLPDENMFNGRLHGKIQIKLRMVLRNILASNFQFLLKLNTDDLGRRFEVAVLCGVQHSSFLSDVCLSKNIVLVNDAINFIRFKNIMLRMSQSSYSAPAASGERLNQIKLRLQNTDTDTEHTREKIQNALSTLCQYIDISLMSVMAASDKSLHKSNAFIFPTLTSEKWHEISLKSDQFSSKLKQASLLYMTEFPDASLDVLLDLERRLRHQFSFCTCFKRLNPIAEEELLSLEGNTAEEMLKKCIIPCVVYLPAEKDLTPTAICYEMNRSLGFPDDDRKNWYDWAIVDGKILLYFLLYLNHRHFGMRDQAAADEENFIRLIKSDIYLGHRETALNLLGWIYKERGRVDSAVECFRESLTIQRTHNAAFCHLRDIENVLHVFLSSRFPVT